MGGFGRQVLESTGRPVAALAVPDGVDWKVGGVTIDWSLITAVSGSDATLDDETIVKIGDKYLRYGQVLCKITTQEVQTVDLSGADDPNGGDWDLTILGETIEDIAWNVSAATLQAAIRSALEDTEHADKITVSKTGFVYTITFPLEMGNVTAVTADGGDLTTAGSTVTVTITTTTGGVSNNGMFGPYDSAASDGRQTLSRGNCFVLNETVVYSELGSNHPPVFDGGIVWKDRIIATSGTHSLADGPTYTEFETVFPRIGYAQD